MVKPSKKLLETQRKRLAPYPSNFVVVIGTEKHRCERIVKVVHATTATSGELAEVAKSRSLCEGLVKLFEISDRT
jgi:hypothetical protein